MKSVRIYRLIDPRCGSTRYVGQTCNSLKSRLAMHVSKPGSYQMREWVSELISSGMKPVISKLRECDIETALDVEYRYIKKMKYAGFPLLNSDKFPHRINGYQDCYFGTTLKNGFTEYVVELNPQSAEWAKQQPGGLSAMIRTYLDNQYRIDSELKDLNARLQRSADKGE